MCGGGPGAAGGDFSPSPRARLPRYGRSTSKKPLHFPQILCVEGRRRSAEKLLEVRLRSGGLTRARERGAKVVQRVEVPCIQLHGAGPGVDRRLAVARSQRAKSWARTRAPR